MLRKTVIALLAVASIGLVSPTMALARGGGGGAVALAAVVAAATEAAWAAGRGGGFYGGGFGGGGFGGGGFHGGGIAGGSMEAAWRADSMMAVVSTEVDFVVVDSTAVDFMIAARGRFGFGFYPYGYYDDYVTTIRMAIIRMPTAIHTMTTAVATWSGDACTPSMAGACNPTRFAVDGP